LSKCSLCFSEDSSLYYKNEKREYRLCSTCSLVYTLENSFLDAQDEKARYELHTNSPDDKNYRKFLSKVFNPVLDRLEKNAFGLDFGSGPGPTLSKMFEEDGFKINIYDIYFAPDADVLELKYDFITSTEVVEHLYKPREVLDNLFDMLKPSAFLTLLTQPYPNKKEFASWYYKNDPTHVCFFSLDTFKYLAKEYKGKLEVIGKDVFILRKNDVN